MKEIKLTQGKVALVDDQDYEYLNQFKWYALKAVSTYYATRSKYSEKGTTSMHREILGLTDPKIFTDHKDHNGLNNQRNNIRECTPAQNAQNQSSRGESLYLGVNPHISKKRYTTTKGEQREHLSFGYRAAIVVDKKQRHLGKFKTEIEAAIIYNIAARKYHGEFANPNKF